MMNNKNMYRKGWSVAIIALIISVVFAPTIYANFYTQNELIEITTEFCGLGKKHVEKLTIEQAKELDNYLADIRKSILEVNNKEESVQILKEGLKGISRFNLFGNIGADKVIELVEKDWGFFQDFNYDNSLCIIFGGLSGDYFIITPLALSLALFLEYLAFRSKQLGLEKFHDIVELSLYLFAIVWICFLANKPINIFATYLEFVPYPYGSCQKADIISIGKNGRVHFDYVDIIIGFTGIKIYNPLGEFNKILFGYALGIEEF